MQLDISEFEFTTVHMQRVSVDMFVCVCVFVCVYVSARVPRRDCTGW